MGKGSRSPDTDSAAKNKGGSVVNRASQLVVERPCLVFWVILGIVFVLSALPFLFKLDILLDTSTKAFATRGTYISNYETARTTVLEYIQDENGGGEDNEFRRRRRLTQGQHGVDPYSFGIGNVSPRKLHETIRAKENKRSLETLSQLEACLNTTCSTEWDSCKASRPVADSVCENALFMSAQCGEHDTLTCMEELIDESEAIFGVPGLLKCARNAMNSSSTCMDHASSMQGKKHRNLDIMIVYWPKDRKSNVLSENLLQQAVAVEEFIVETIAKDGYCKKPYPSEVHGLGDVHNECAEWAASGSCVRHQGFMNRFCRYSCDTMDSKRATNTLESQCAQPASILPSLFPNYPSAEGGLNGVSLETKISSLAGWSDHKMVESWSGVEYGWFFDKYFSTCNMTSLILRSMVHFQGPDETDQDDDTFYNYRTELWAKVVEKAGEIAPDLDIVHFDREREGLVLNQVLMSDSLFVIGVIITVFMLTWYHTNSFFIAFCSFLQVKLTFPLTFFFYRVIFNIEWIGTLNFLALFVITGVGADDTFVLHDAWVQSGIIYGREELLERMKWTLKRASKSMGVTSITGAAAFFANMISTIPPLRVFGLWTGLLLLMDFILSCTFLPAALVIQHQYFGSCCSRGQKGDRSKIAPSEEGERVDQKKNSAEADPTKDRRKTFAELAVGDHVGEMRPMERFFIQYYTNFMKKYAGRVVLGKCTILAICMNVMLSLGAQKENPILFHESHNFWKVETLEKDLFPSNVYPLPIHVMFGVLPKDTGRPIDPASKSDVVWNKDMDMADPDAQLHVASICDSLLGATDIVRLVTSCWIYDFREYAKQVGAGFPVMDRANFSSTMKAFLLTKDGKEYVNQNDVFFDLKEDRVSYFRISALSQADMSMLFQLDRIERSFENWDLWIRNRNTEWAAKRAGATCLEALELRTLETDASRDKILQACGLTLEDSHFLGLGQAFATGAGFLLYDTIENLQVVGRLAILISWILSVLFITFSTNNWRIGFFAGLTLASIVCQMLTLMALGGFTIGVLESIALSILVGLSVDYTSHLAQAIVESPVYLSSADRMQYGVSHLGISVVFGALTTASSGIFLFFTKIVFFRMFGWFIVTVVVLSLLNTLGLFCALVCWWGPTGTQGKLIKSSLKDVDKKKKEDRTARKSHAPHLDYFVNTLTSSDEIPAKEKKFVTIVSVLTVLVGLIFCVANVIQTNLPDLPDIGSLYQDPENVALNMTFPTTQLNAKRTQYLCSGFGFTNPDEPTVYVNRIEVIDKRPSIVHHMVAFRMLSVPRKCPFACYDMPETTGVVYAWAIGALGMTLPDGVAIPVGGKSSTSAIALQIHYDNWEGLPTSDPGSGLIMHGSLTKPSHLVTTFAVGFATNSPKVAIPPKESAFTLRTRCKPKLVGNVTLIAYGHHAHTLGTKVLARQYRNDEFIGMLGTVDPYDFDYQNLEPFDAPQPVLVPGDEIEIECTYNSMNQESYTYGGLETQDEMCMTFILAYPQEYIVEPFCYTY